MSGHELLIAEVAASAFAQAQRTRAQTKAARYEAEIARQQADYERRVAEAKADRIRNDADRALGKQVARLAAAGQDPGAGSALLAQQMLASDAEIEALEIRNAGRLRAASLERSAALALNRARDEGRQRFIALGTRLLNDEI